MTPIPIHVQSSLKQHLLQAQVLAARQSPPPQVTPSPDFHDLVDSSDGPWGCWPWIGGLSPQGYGMTCVRRAGFSVATGAHRVAYYLDTGYWGVGNRGPVIRHLCHNHACCNPRHLLVGSRTANVWDSQMRRLGVDLVAVRMLVERPQRRTRARAAA